MADAERALAEHGPELELDRGRIGERAFRADEDMGQVVRGRVRQERVEVVAADAALHLGKARRDLVGLAFADGEKPADELGVLRVRARLRAPRGHGTEMHALAIGQDGVDRDDIVAHRAVAQRAAAAGVIARHAADGGARGGRDVDREPEPMRFQNPVELIEHDARLDHAAPRRDIEREEAVEIFRAVDHEARIDRLAGLRGPRAARRHRDAFLARHGERSHGVVHRLRHDDAERHHLIMGGVGRVAAAREAVEGDLARHLAPQPSLEPGPHAVRHAFRPLSDRADCRAITLCLLHP